MSTSNHRPHKLTLQKNFEERIPIHTLNSTFFKWGRVKKNQLFFTIPSYTSIRLVKIFFLPISITLKPKKQRPKQKIYNNVELTKQKKRKRKKVCHIAECYPRKRWAATLLVVWQLDDLPFQGFFSFYVFPLFFSCLAREMRGKNFIGNTFRCYILVSLKLGILNHLVWCMYI